MTSSVAWWPPVFEDGVDPAQQTLSIETFFAADPSERVKRELLAAMPYPFREWGCWVGSVLHAHTGEWPDTRLRRAYEPEVVRFIAGLDATLSEDDVSERWSAAFKASPSSDTRKSNWAKFWTHIGTWLESCTKAGSVVFVVASAPMEIPGYAEALRRGRASVTDVLVPHLTGLYARGVGNGAEAILFGNIAGGIASEAAGCNKDDAPPLDESARKNLQALANEAIKRKSPTKGWWTDVLDIVAPREKPKRTTAAKKSSTRATKAKQRPATKKSSTSKKRLT